MKETEEEEMLSPYQWRAKFHPIYFDLWTEEQVMEYFNYRLKSSLPSEQEIEDVFYEFSFNQMGSPILDKEEFKKAVLHLLTKEDR